MTYGCLPSICQLSWGGNGSHYNHTERETVRLSQVMHKFPRVIVSVYIVDNWVCIDNFFVPKRLCFCLFRRSVGEIGEQTRRIRSLSRLPRFEKYFTKITPIFRKTC